MNRFTITLLCLSFAPLLSIAACGDEEPTPTESAPSRAGESAEHPAGRERTTVEITVPRPPTVTVTPPQPGSVEVH